MKTTNDKYEGEIGELKIENNRLKESISDLQKTLNEQKEAYEFRIVNGERDIKDMLSKISQIDGYIEANPSSLVGRDGSMGASNFIIEQLLKEKNEAERKYKAFLDTLAKIPVYAEHDEYYKSYNNITSEDNTKK